ncbi:DUF305 domain-containing protein [Yoonia sp. MH D7]
MRFAGHCVQCGVVALAGVRFGHGMNVQQPVDLTTVFALSAFACAMIAHHQGAIEMAQVLLDHGDDPEMVELAQEIMDAQVDEIEVMTNWLAENVK